MHNVGVKNNTIIQNIQPVPAIAKGYHSKVLINRIDDRKAKPGVSESHKWITAWRGDMSKKNMACGWVNLAMGTTKMDQPMLNMIPIFSWP